MIFSLFYFKSPHICKTKSLKLS